MFKLACKDIQEKYGNIRVHLFPTLGGDKISINFRDYDKDNQPMQLDGVHKKSIGIDRSYPTIETISNAINYFTDDNFES